MADQASAEQFNSAVQSNWYELTGESGGGGIAGARKADTAAQAGGKPWQSPALLVSAALLPLVYLVVAAVLFGAGSLGGLINLVSKQPEFMSSGEVSLRYGSHDRIEAPVAV